MESQAMETEKTPVDAMEGAGRDDEAGGALERLVPVADSTADTIRETPYLHINVAIGLLAVVAFVAALYLARAFFVPLLIGILASYALSPVVEWLKRCYIPRAAGAALVLVVLVGGYCRIRVHALVAEPVCGR
ncbi:MAG: Uncharacterized protein AWT59_1375 [Candidatus Gallionella acididurans]|uniref:AI-2E family transporter n=1 Tax=Candidatus Gallionella acididurans TaxID=1796491 RepID=A0A139BU19_9PROT|nr:MAG: Uncharacterized protein AWT59_1375 [Candidatus Gallionella acididurans]